MLEKNKRKPKLLVVLGPTAVGKSDLAVHLARRFGGEVISADSRQVYRGLDIGTGKITKKEMLAVPHHLLNVVSPHKNFSVAEWREMAEKAILDISGRGKLPIICGGTAFYIRAIADGISLPDVPPDQSLRAKLSQKSPEELFRMLRKMDQARAETIDRRNPVRLIRAIEIASSLGHVPAPRLESPYDLCIIGLVVEEKKLKQRIRKRLMARMKNGMVAEVKRLHAAGISWKRLSELGLEYAAISSYLRGQISKEEMLLQIENESWQYVRRQMQWWKRDKRIRWFNPKETVRISRIVKKFLD